MTSIGTVQCDSCHEYSKGPSTTGGHPIAWSCPRCHARHEVVMYGGNVRTKRLLDRVTVPAHLKVSAGVKQDIREAATAINGGAPRAAAVMMRRALERRLTELGGTSKTLHGKIKKLGEDGTLDEITVGGATAIRFFGNYGAHPQDDLLEEVDIEKAQRAYTLTIEILQQMSK